MEQDNELERKLNGRDFYELCQQYRHCPVDPAGPFQQIKDYLLNDKLPWPSYESLEEG